jgi:regulator of cell morphogenesis and NO signaling
MQTGAINVKTIVAKQTVGEIASQLPGAAAVFESLGIDYCCGGKRTLAEACQKKGLDPDAVLVSVQQHHRAAAGSAPSPDVTRMSLTELADHIEKTHHAFVRKELPRLAGLTQKVASAHGDTDPRLRQVHETFRAMALELLNHMMKEERCLFPMIRQLEAGGMLLSVHGATVANPIRQMEFEHDDAGIALAGLRELTDGFAPPEGACQSYRALLGGLADFERDMHAHIHKENNVLFPSAVKLEATLRRGMPVA